MKLMPLMVALLVVAGCSTPGGWMRAGISPESTSAALAACRAQATRAGDDRYATEGRILADRSSGASGTLGSPGGDLGFQRERMASDRRRLVAAAVDACMESRGFQRVEATQ
ncbi:MAG: hypothetical protein EAZ99_01580 [Alphaproteobacteria bacterium]|nr:hypothetical protein [Alphaproteobacteria bacterium]TAD92039.1 MAG: hypothetical protein EAZ99_01580 [Alphaproteobacteria bacterium]